METEEWEWIDSQSNSAYGTDDDVLRVWLSGISRKLREADVNPKIVQDIEDHIKNLAKLDYLAAGVNKGIIIHQAVFKEICKMLDLRKPSFSPRKAKTSVVVFVGLQGSGKTTICAKYACYYKNKGWKPALVCADTFRAGAFDQLKQDAAKAEIPFYGSYTELDPVKVAVVGAERLKKEGFNLIIVDTHGCHKQNASLFEEMRKVYEATEPDLVIYVADSSIGQSAFDQAEAFKQSFAVGAVIVTKMDSHAKGGGVLSVVAAAKSPVIFTGFGVDRGGLEVFDVKSFVSRLLGIADWYGFMNHPHALQQVAEGNSSFRIIHEQMEAMLKSLSTCHEKESNAKLRRYKGLVDSMTNAELDGVFLTNSRMKRIAKGCGRDLDEVIEMVEGYYEFCDDMKEIFGDSDDLEY